MTTEITYLGLPSAQAALIKRLLEIGDTLAFAADGGLMVHPDLVAEHRDLRAQLAALDPLVVDEQSGETVP